MPIVHFLGKILPLTFYQLNAHELPGLNFIPADESFSVSFSIDIKNSAVDVKCSTTKFDSEIMAVIHKHAYDFARATVNLFSFSSGITLSVIFDEYINPDGAKTPFVIRDHSLAGLCTAFNMNDTTMPTSLSRIMNIVLTEPSLWLALDDLMTAATAHSFVVVNSARAMEGLRHTMAPPGMARNDAWELFRTNLRITKDYLHLITDTSTAGRHGNHTFVPGTITAEIMKRSRTIMNRFFEFRLRNNQPLDTSEFPLLDS